MLPEKIGGIRMRVLKETAVAIVAVFALLSACDAMFGSGPTRFDDEYYRASFYAPKGVSEFRFAANTPPAARVSDAFAQFTPGEAKTNRRYSALPTIIR
jgi:hypothetical protein